MEKEKEKTLNAVRVNLNEELATDLKDIKKYYGIVSDSDMIRFLIREHKKEIMKKEDYYTLLGKKSKF